MSETKTITIAVYRDTEGKPVCGFNFRDGSFCLFLRVLNFGTVDSCGWDGSDLERLPKPVGFLRPHSLCPLWKDEA